MKRILFVDDEPSILSGIRRVVRPLRDEWDVDYAEGGRRAIEMAGAAPYDVIVSDMKMPDCDGVAVLREVQRISPSTVRIVLSGHCDRAQIVRAVLHTHQFVAKPCDSDQLVRELRRAVRLGEILSDRAVAELCSGFESMPSLPSTYTEIVAELQKDEPSVESVARVVAQDAAMSARTLKLVNSPFFGLASEVSSPEQAVKYLGVETMRALALQIGVFSQIRGGERVLARLARSNEIATASASLVRRAARILGFAPAVTDHAFVGALLHEIGLVTLAHGAPERFDTVASIDAHGPQREALEIAALGTTTSAIGAYLLGVWGLPGTAIEIVADREVPSRSDETAPGPVGLVHACCLLARHGAGRTWREELDPIYLERTGLGAHLDAIAALLEESK